jgi:FAD/FMN-containing dehydrogenase
MYTYAAKVWDLFIVQGPFSAPSPDVPIRDFLVQVVKVNNEMEMCEILQLARKHQTPVTFRAAGTSLSGQAITDSILLKISHTGKNFRNYQILVRFPLHPVSRHVPVQVNGGRLAAGVGFSEVVRERGRAL